MWSVTHKSAIAIAVIGLSDCLGPTEIEVQISTDVACKDVNSTAVAVGPAGDDSRAVGAKTSSCADGGAIGTLVVTPSGGLDDVVGIRVTLGVGAAQADVCHAPDYPGCIVARRSLHFVPHATLSLPIALQQSCFGQVCDPNSTCLNGSCIDAGIPSCDPTNTCPLPAPDAGACGGLVPTLVVPLTTPATPHLITTATGYAIGYETSANAYEIVAVTPSGVASPPIQASSTAVATTIPVGAFGTDGAHYVTTYVSQLGLVLDEYAIDGGFVTTSTNFVAPLPPVRGVYFDGTSFLTFATQKGTPTWVVWTPGSQALSISPGGVNYGDPAFAFYNGIAYGSVHVGTTLCQLYTGTPNASGMTFGPTFTWSACSTIRFAENAPGVQLFAFEQAGLLRLADSATSTTPAAFGQVDSQAIVALPASGSTFHVVSGAGGSIARMTADVTNLGAAQPKSVIAATGFPGAAVAFDAVADSPATSYAIAFWSATPSPGIYLARFCD